MMSATYLLCVIAGSASLLLWGIRMARTAVTRAHGSRIRDFLPKTLGNRFYAAFTGIGAAAVLQSSTAVAVFIASLATMGMVPLPGGLAVMLGADIGSAVVAALLTFNLKSYWPILILAGYVVHSLYENTRSKAKQNGRFILGLGLVLISLTFMSQVSSQLSSNATLRTVLSSLSGEPVLAVLVLAGLTWLAHSSISMLLFMASLADAGLVSDSAFFAAAVLGVNLGGAMPAIVLTWRQSAAARRIVAGNGLFRLIGVLAGLAFVDSVGELFDLLPGVPGFRLVLLHMLFNLCLAVVFIGFVGQFSRLLERLIPEPAPASEEEVFGPRYIPRNSDSKAVMPLFALTRETLRMTDVVQSMLTQTQEVLNAAGPMDKDRRMRIRRLDDRVDTLYKAVRGYAIDLTREELPPDELQRINSLLHYALNLENFGDIIDKSLLDITAQKTKARRSFSEDGNAELSRLFSYVSDSLQLSAEVVMGWKADAAANLRERKREFKILARESSSRHIERLRRGVSSSLQTSSYHLDIVNDLQRMNSLVTAVAEDVIPAPPVSEAPLLDARRLE